MTTRLAATAFLLAALCGSAGLQVGTDASRPGGAARRHAPEERGDERIPRHPRAQRAEARASGSAAEEDASPTTDSSDDVAACDARIVGRLVDAAGRGIPGAVHIWTPDGEVTAEGSGGLFSADLDEAKARSGGYRIVAWAAGSAARVGAWHELVRGAVTDSGDFALAPAAPFRVYVDHDDPRCDGDTVHVDASSAYSHEEWAVLDACDADEVCVHGPYKIDWLPAGSFPVWTSGNDAVFSAADTDSDSGVLHLAGANPSCAGPPPPEPDSAEGASGEPPIGLSGRVYMNGSPLTWSPLVVEGTRRSGFRVVNEGSGFTMRIAIERRSPEDAPPALRSGDTAEDGSFAFDDAPAGEYDCCAYVAHAWSADTPPAPQRFRARAGTGRVDVVLHSTVVRDFEVETEPPAKASIAPSVCVRPADLSLSSPKVDVDIWRVRVSRLDPEVTYELEIDGDAPWAPLLVDPVRPAAFPVQVTLARGLEVAGRVLAPDGEPVPFAAVHARLPGWRATRETHAGTDGRFVVRGLPAGDVTLTSCSAAWATADDREPVAAGSAGVVLVLSERK